MERRRGETRAGGARGWTHGRWRCDEMRLFDGSAVYKMQYTSTQQTHKTQLPQSTINTTTTVHALRRKSPASPYILEVSQITVERHTLAAGAHSLERTQLSVSRQSRPAPAHSISCWSSLASYSVGYSLEPCLFMLPIGLVIAAGTEPEPTASPRPQI